MEPCPEPCLPAGTPGLWDTGVSCYQPPACTLYSAHQWSRQEWLYCGSECIIPSTPLPPPSSPALLLHHSPPTLPFSLPLQDTSVLSPIISPIIISATLVYHAHYSPSQLAHTHYLLFFAAFGLQVTKTALHMMVSTCVLCGSRHLISCPQLSGMTRTPYPLLHPIMVGPVLLCFNIHFPLIPDLLLLSLVAVRPTSCGADVP